MKETARARQAWADYLALGPDRSLEKLLQRYQSGTKAAPATSLTRLKLWSRTFGWQQRLQVIADEVARAAEEKEREYRRLIMEDGYALPHERVRALKQLAGILFEELTAEDEAANRLWIDDVKQVGKGEGALRVDIERFNTGEVDQFRRVLDDIAKETGGRAAKVEHTGKDGAPIQITEIVAVLPPESRDE